MKISSILCVCTGNICRSPLAQAYLEKKLTNVYVRSAGIAAVSGHGIESTAGAIANREGLDVSNHTARQMTAEMANEYDIILVMEQGQRDWICERFPHVRGRVFIVSKWEDDQEVADPVNRSPEFFDIVYQRMRKCLDQWVQRLAPA